MIETISRKISSRIKDADPDNTASVEVMAYAIGVYINFFSVVVISLLTGLIADKFIETCIALAGFGILRLVSGGRHLKSLTACVAVSVIAFSALPYINLHVSTFMLTSISVIIAVLFAPFIHEETNMPRKWSPYLKAASLVVISSNYIFNSEILGMSFFFQCILLISMKGGVSK